MNLDSDTPQGPYRLAATEVEAMTLGRACARRDDTPDDNPFEPGTPCHWAWRDGLERERAMMKRERAEERRGDRA